MKLFALLFSSALFAQTPNLEQLKKEAIAGVDARSNYPAARTLIVSGMLESCLRSKAQGSQVLATPR